MTDPTANVDTTAATASTQALVENADRLGLKWDLRPATVVQAAPTITLVYDGDITAITAVSMIGPVANGDRVYVIFVPPSGNFIAGSTTGLGSRVIARGLRTSNQTSTGTESGVLRLTGVPVQADHGYHIYTSTLNLQPSATGLTAEARIRITTNNTTPTSSSTQVGSGLMEGVATSVPRNGTVVATEYYPVADGVLGVFLGWILVGGAGTATLLGGTTSPIALYVEDMGADVGLKYATVL